MLEYIDFIMDVLLATLGMVAFGAVVSFIIAILMTFIKGDW